MQARHLSTTVRRAEGVAVIELEGEINAFAEEALNAAYQEATQAHTPAILLNFAGVDYINSTGIALIVGVLAQARTAGIRLLTCGLSPHYTEVFRITRLCDFMTIVVDEEAALAEAKATS